MKRQITRWDTGIVIWEGEAETVKDVIHAVYADGYASFSPAEAFESGYTRVVEPRAVSGGGVEVVEKSVQ